MSAEIEKLRELIGDDGLKRVLKRLDGEPHRHHKNCIHNLPADDQIARRGRTREWWEAMGLPEPVVIDSSQWEVDAEYTESVNNATTKNQIGEPG